jgi:hypothetical protein
MKITTKIEVEAKRLRVEFPLRYLDEEDSAQALLPHRGSRRFSETLEEWVAE